MAMRVVGNVRPRPEAPPPPSPPVVAEVDRQIEATRQALARETDPAQAEVLLKRLDFLKHRRQALLLTEGNRVQQGQAAVVEAVRKQERDAARRQLGLTADQVREKVQALTEELQRLEAELGVIQSGMDRLGEQAHQELPHIPLRALPELVWSMPEGGIARGKRDANDVRRYAIAQELNQLRPLLEPDAAPISTPS